MNDLHKSGSIEPSTYDLIYWELCKGIPRQRLLKVMRESTLEKMKEEIPDEEVAENVFDILKTCKEGYMRIQRQWPSLGEIHEGWTYVFAVGFPLHIDNPEEWYSTSNIEKIDWEGNTFCTKNSVYSFTIMNNQE